MPVGIAKNGTGVSVWGGSEVGLVLPELLLFCFVTVPGMSAFWGKPEVILHQPTGRVHLVLLSDPFRVREIVGFEGCLEICVGFME